MCRKMQFFSNGPRYPLKCVTPPKKWYHHVAQYSAHLKPPKPRRPLITPSSRKLWFSEGPVFWQNYSNGPGVAKSWHMTKVTIRYHKRCVKLSWVQIWQKNSNGKCPKLPITDSHSWCYYVIKCKLKPPNKEAMWLHAELFFSCIVLFAVHSGVFVAVSQRYN